MAKLSAVLRNEKRRKLVAKYAAKRAELLKIIQDPKGSDEERQAARAKLESFPRNASPVRVRATGARSRGVPAGTSASSGSRAARCARSP